MGPRKSGLLDPVFAPHQKLVTVIGPNGQEARAYINHQGYWTFEPGVRAFTPTAWWAEEDDEES